MRILLVEVNKSLCETLAEALSEDGYAVDMASDGEEAVYRVMVWDYDLVVLDVMLPKIDGWEVLDSIRNAANKEKQNTPVLMLTARDSVEDRVKGLDHGADDYLVKPFTLEELGARIRSVIRRSRGTRSPIIELGAITINSSTKTVSVDGVPIDMTSVEYSLFDTLVAKRGEVVSRTYLYDHLFAEEHSSLSNMLDVYICNLRKKLGKEVIKTRRGEGYMVDG